MIVEITIKDESGKVFAEYQGDAFKPGDYKCHPDKPIQGEDDASFWKLWGLIYQPNVVRTMKEKAHK